ncbi:hypothetical protein CYK37_29055 [Mesorhizobium loti]|nr:hypothetical protein CYK37_29055 [Mesorhizobium loti]
MERPRRIDDEIWPLRAQGGCNVGAIKRKRPNLSPPSVTRAKRLDAREVAAADDEFKLRYVR